MNDDTLEEIKSPVDAPTDDGEDQGNRGPQTELNLPVDPVVQHTIDQIIELQRQRVLCIRSQSRCDRSIESTIARTIGFRVDMESADRLALYKRAAAARKAVEKTQMPHADVPESLVPLVLLSAESRAPWDRYRPQVEAAMSREAKTLPGYTFVKNVKGFGDLGFAIIVGEAGDLGSYRTQYRLWKRLGLGVIDMPDGTAVRQQKRLDPEQAKLHGYNPRRRAEMWTLGDSMFRHQWRGAVVVLRNAIAEHDLASSACEQRGIKLAKEKKAEILQPIADEFGIVVAGGEAAGPYGEVYLKRKESTGSRDPVWSLKHREDDARRVMFKQLIEDLWRIWRKTVIAANT